MYTYYVYLMYFRLTFGVPVKRTFKNNEIPAMLLVCYLLL